jgi:hypothetical protein
MPIVVPFPTPPSTVYPVGQPPALTLTRGADVLPLTLTQGWVVLPGVEGLDDPPRSLIEVTPATGDGSIVTDARYTPREVFLPLHYKAGTTGALRATLRAVASLMDAKAGPVTLEVAHADGTRRYCDGYLTQPYGQALGSGEGAGLWRQVGLRLRCPDPFFAGDSATLSWALGGDPPPFLGGEFLPLGLANSQVLGAGVEVVNAGDAYAYPLWTLTGPFDAATVSCGASEWAVPDGLDEGETLVIDARRGVKTCTVNGAPAWGRLAPGSIIESLPPGPTTLNVEAVGATAASSIALTYRERWLTAW